MADQLAGGMQVKTFPVRRERIVLCEERISASQTFDIAKHKGNIAGFIFCPVGTFIGDICPDGVRRVNGAVLGSYKVSVNDYSQAVHGESLANG